MLLFNSPKLKHWMITRMISEIVILLLTCSLWPWGKYTTLLPTTGRDTNGPAQACQSSEFKHFLSPTANQMESKPSNIREEEIRAPIKLENLTQKYNQYTVHKGKNSYNVPSSDWGAKPVVDNLILTNQ